MAIFLLLYVVFVLVWFTWVSVLVWHLLKYRFPNDKEAFTLLGIFLAVSLITLLVSVVFIGKADWVSVPPALKGL